MRIFFLIYLTFSYTAFAQNLIKVNGKESDDFQESTFIKLMSHLSDGKIPYPFSDLLDSFKIGVREYGNVLFIPKGRSLVKNLSDYKNPRILVNPLEVRNISEIEAPYLLNREAIGNGQL